MSKRDPGLMGEGSEAQTRAGRVRALAEALRDEHDPHRAALALYRVAGMEAVFAYNRQDSVASAVWDRAARVLYPLAWPALPPHERGPRPPSAHRRPPSAHRRPARSRAPVRRRVAR